MYKQRWYLLDEQDDPYPTDDMYAAEALLNDIDARRIDLTEIDREGHKISISTVFLVMDHSHTYVPDLYETMVFMDDIIIAIGGYTKRYTTKSEAISGHQEIVDSIKQLSVDFRASTWVNEKPDNAS